jgi:hypothetical protein
MAATCDKRSTALLVVALLCFVAFATFRGDTRSDGREAVTEWSIGLWFSPWYRYVKRAGADGFQIRARVQLLSWSWPALAAGLACLAARGRRRRA